ncbi:hypothetical protein DPMN_193382 [Dreissena polymorpha]|uniref:Secreted protein n=1 Tax=Dreissena polymorpha TaxID=45954 RepID=A0A9D3Y6A9_DREPO|nr:hypothetical protein DPMN_193382 [Dreissena polymorpha]
MVSIVFGLTCFYSCQVATTQGPTYPSSQQRVASNEKTSAVGWSDCVRTELQNCGIRKSLLTQSSKDGGQGQENSTYPHGHDGICGFISGCAIPLNRLKVT